LLTGANAPQQQQGAALAASSSCSAHLAEELFRQNPLAASL
jgi:hypothetical protein